MTEAKQDLEHRLSRLRQATDRLRPNPDFNARVMAAIEIAHEPSLLEQLRRTTFRFLPIAVFAVAAATFWAVHNEALADEAMALSYDAALSEDIE